MAVTSFPEFTQTRINLDFVRGFSSVPFLTETSDEPTEGTSLRTEALVRLISNLQEAAFGKLMQTMDWVEYDGVYVDGGATDGVDFAAVAAATGLPIWQGCGGRFAGEAGGMMILEEMGLRGMVCDLGQSGIKISWAGRRWSFARDQEILWERAGGEAIPIKGEQRRALRKFLGEAIRTATDEAGAGWPEGIVCALPSALDKWGQPLGSSYIGMTNDTQLVPDALEIAGWRDGQIFLLNDAELTAISALQDDRIHDSLMVLVVTLGFAIGTASLDLVKQSLAQ